MYGYSERKLKFMPKNTGSSDAQRCEWWIKTTFTIYLFTGLCVYFTFTYEKISGAYRVLISHGGSV